MKFTRIISNSFKVPFRNYKNLALFCVLFVLGLVGYVGNVINNSLIMQIGLVTFIVLALIVPGYLLSVVREGTDDSDKLPSLNIVKNIVDTLKLVLLNIVFMLIPSIVSFALLLPTGMVAISNWDSIFSVNNVGTSNFFTMALIIFIVIFLLYFIFLIFEYVAMARFAHYDSLTEALSLRKVYSDIREIGVLKTVGLIVVMGIIVIIITRIALLLLLIPYVGVVIYLCLIIPLFSVIFYYSLGLLYSDISGASDLGAFERELMEFRINNSNLK